MCGIYAIIRNSPRRRNAPTPDHGEPVDLETQTVTPMKGGTAMEDKPFAKVKKYRRWLIVHSVGLGMLIQGLVVNIYRDCGPNAFFDVSDLATYYMLVVSICCWVIFIRWDLRAMREQDQEEEQARENEGSDT